MKEYGARYYKTNESLNSIIRGMDVKKEDKILAILGSGDQPIAMSKFCRNIHAIDNYPPQIEYAKDRINLLREKKFEDFLSIYENKYPYNFFSDIKKWRLNLEGLKMIEGDILKSNWNRYNKIYLSNILNCSYQELNYQERLKKFRERINGLKRCSLIYIVTFEQDIKELLFEQEKINSIRINDRLTNNAKDYMGEFNEEGWVPLVFQKI